ncbi:flavin-containing monooxygenase FMO GS-OX-like 3 isoform X2 [Papaver somniferum]|uniref:flavin-containing monooxygenase FMO GS-OX-like 3 isoform X2 n=1 Tax=Papaver somniferum TaxID=3469 RepID=UPI000E703A3B|nr:flavin-containing monooxygenase FMO GS-OX-like 3 isoform X2 [Papaver somniferum]
MISRKVAVIGAGAAGLIASRELRREGHEVVVFEQSDRVGGTWVYNPNVDSDPLGLDSSRTIIFNSLYESLRVNLPREVMGFRDYPFVAQVNDDGRDPRRFPHHTEVLHYLEDFANHFGLIELIRFETEVIYVGLLEEEEELKNKWVVRYRKKGEVGSSSVAHEVFDAVVVCSGHHTHPNIAEIPGIDAWPGKQLHSHSYRVPEPFSGQVVLLIGNRASAADISKKIFTVAKEVHIASRSTMNVSPTKWFGNNNMRHHPLVKCAHEDGTVVFQDRSLVRVDVIVQCTGYKYCFPFLEISDIVTVDDNCVGPLYQHIFPPVLAPGLSFIGLTWMAPPFPTFELQSKWVAGVLSGRISLPYKDKMIKDVEAFYFQLKVAAVPKHYTHFLGEKQFDYADWLAAESGCQPLEEWRKEMAKERDRNATARPESYRDEWEDGDLIVQAHEDFSQYLPAELCGRTSKHSFELISIQMPTLTKVGNNTVMIADPRTLLIRWFFAGSFLLTACTKQKLPAHSL